MGQLVEDEVAVDLVGAQHEVVAAAEVDDRRDLVPAPHPAQRVVRMAEEQHAGVGVTAASIASSGSCQRPPAKAAGTVTSRRPWSGGASRNGG